MENEKTGRSRSAAGLFWGRSGELPLHMRVVGLVFIAAVIVSLTFCQLSFWPMGEIDDFPVCLVLLLAPVAMGALAFGPVTGALLGALGGVVAFAHGVLLPLNSVEIYYFGSSPITVAQWYALVSVPTSESAPRRSTHFRT